MDTLPPELMQAFFEQTLSRGISVIALYVFPADLEWPSTYCPTRTHLSAFIWQTLAGGIPFVALCAILWNLLLHSS